MLAIMVGLDVDMIKLLLERGADVNEPARVHLFMSDDFQNGDRSNHSIDLHTGLTPIMAAILCNGAPEVIRLLLLFDADIEVSYFGIKPANASILRFRPDMLRLFREKQGQVSMPQNGLEALTYLKLSSSRSPSQGKIKLD